MQLIKDFLEEKKRKMTIKAFDTIIEEKREELGGMIRNNKREVAIGAGVMAGLIVLGCLKMRHSSDNPETVVIIINNNII